MVSADSAEPSLHERRQLRAEPPLHELRQLPLPAQLHSPLRTRRHAPEDAPPVRDVQHAR